MIILKEAMNMNAAQHCVHNVFAFPSNREVSKGRFSIEDIFRKTPIDTKSRPRSIMTIIKN